MHKHNLIVFGHYHHTHIHAITADGGGHTHEPDFDEFKLEDYVEFPACPGTLFQIVGGESPFWELKHVAGPKLSDNYHEAYFNVKPPELAPVIDLVLAHVPDMVVLAIMASEE